MKFVVQYLTLMCQKRKSTNMGITNLLWLKRIQKLSCKEHALETNFRKILTTKINYSITNKEIVSLLEKEKKQYFARLNEKDITDNRKFWHNVKPFLSDRVKSREAIISVDNENIKSNENEMANTFNDILKYCEKSKNSGISVWEWPTH